MTQLISAVDLRRLVILAIKGEEIAVIRLYEMFSQGIFRYLYFRTGDRGVAEDLTSEVFIKMILSVRDFKGPSGNFTAWLYTIARNQSIDYARRSSLQREQDLLEDEGDDSQGPEEMHQEKVMRGDLHSNIMGLSKGHREVITLRFISQLSLHDTARVLGKSEDAVKGLQRRALEALRENMDQWKE